MTSMWSPSNKGFVLREAADTSQQLEDGLHLSWNNPQLITDLHARQILQQTKA